jgi:hypothetical protein
MVETITPVVYGGRGRWVGALGLHVLGATLTAAVFGALLGAVGALLGAPFGRPGLVLVGGAAALYALGTLPRLRVTVPQLRRQVPDWWRTFFSPPVTSFLYGAGLGIGFLTFMASGGLVAVSIAAAASGSLWLGALLVAPFGFARGVSAVVAADVRTPDDGRRLVERLAGRSDRSRRIANGVALLLVTALAVVSVPAAAAGGWGDLATAVLAVAFAWASISKLATWRRWRRTLAAHHLLRRLEDLARWSVPAAEAVVPALALLGLRTGAAAWALVLLAGFSAEVVRVRVVIGPSVPCGCFGGRDAIDVGAVLARNAGFAALAAVGLVEAQDAAVLRWPGVPGPSEIVPMVLASVGLVVAVSTAWQARVWLGRKA